MTSISGALAAAARRNPDGVALVDESGRPVSYADLLTAVTSLAATLRVRTSPAGRVGIVSRKSASTVVAMLGALTAGRCYVPVDSSAPAARREFILRQSGCELLVGDPAEARTCAGLPVISATAPASDLAGPAEAGPGPGRLDDDGEAYVLYTSGSTGEPKGVVITRRNATAFIRWAAAAFPLRSGDQVAVHAPLHFDLPVYDIYVGLAAGATLHLVPERTAFFPQGLYRFLAERSITHLYAVPSALTALLNRSTLRSDGLPALRQILYAGEEFRPRALAGLMRVLPQVTVTNLYGPVETNVVTRWTLRQPPRDDERVPLGRPIDGVRIALLDEKGTASEHVAGEGEIVVAGDCVTPGYLGRPDLTSKVMVCLMTETGSRTFYRTGDFASRDADGILRLLGRRDGLVKTRGYRVELGEIETVISAHPAVAEVAVVAEPDPDLTHALHAVVVRSADYDASAPLVDHVLSHCRARLPGYMVPGHVHLVTRLPRTSTGKIARARLGELIGTTEGTP